MAGARRGDKGVAVGTDGTIYVASESLINAYNPDGSAKWTFRAESTRLHLPWHLRRPGWKHLLRQAEGMGVFSLTPAGHAALDNSPKLTIGRSLTYGEIVFGPNGGKTSSTLLRTAHFRAR